MEKKYFAHATALVDEPADIGQGTKIWHFSHILAGVRIGTQCSFGQNCVVGPNVTIGHGVKVQNNVSIYEGVECEDDVFLGPSMVFTNVINPRSFIVRRSEFKRTLLKKGCSVGANATIVCGITIGEYALIGAGSTVTKDVKPFALVYGVPAKQHGWVSKAGNKLVFDANNQAIDEFDGSQYQLKNAAVELYEQERDNHENKLSRLASPVCEL
jgi:UDP-2-acetamido-3-amino-2,3-dideoxy-glucuronate N-acetyltransferase